MADDFVQVPPDNTGKKIRSFKHTVGANDVHTHAMALVDPVSGSAVHPTNEGGTWAYHAGTAGTVTLGGTERVLGIIAYASAAGATCTINGGDSIPVPTGVGIELEPKGNLVGATIVFTGTAMFLVEVVT